jgi:hypothetical protein
MPHIQLDTDNYTGYLCYTHPAAFLTEMTLHFGTVTNDGLPPAFMKLPLSRTPETFLLALLVFPVFYSPVLTLLSCGTPFEFRPTHWLSFTGIFLCSSFPPVKCKDIALNYIKCEILTAVAMETLSWNVMPSNLVELYQRVEINCCLCLQGKKIPGKWRQHLPQ